MKTPCIKRCEAVDGVCVACYRSIDEIMSWASKTGEERKKIIKELGARKRNLAFKAA